MSKLERGIKEELEAIGMWPTLYVAANTEQKPHSPELKESEKPKKKKEVSLGDINPLIKPIDFSNRGVIETNIEVINNLIEEFDGVKPEFMDFVPVFSPKVKGNVARFVTTFVVDELSENKLCLLEQLVKDTYRIPIRTRKSKDGKDINPDEKYPPLRESDTALRNTNGWYFGSGDIPTDPGYYGLYIYQNSGEVTKENFSKKRTSNDSKYIVEVREGQLYQTDMVEFITQVSTILAKDKVEPYGKLSYKIYYDLYRYGMRLIEDSSMHGMDHILQEIKRRLVKPVANNKLSQGLHHQPESVCLIGVPGTGKTMIAKKLIDEDTGVFMVPVTPLTLHQEMKMPIEKQTLLPRIDEVSSNTGRGVILQLDDIEEIAKTEQGQSNFQNLMAGVRDRGFYILASTNEPEVMEQALLQPQRLAVLIHCGLHNKDARREIIKIHAPDKTKLKKHQLFESDEERDLIIDEIAENTNYFTPRYLAQIGTVAKSYLLDRVSYELGIVQGLTENDLREGDKFNWLDWEKALSDVAKKYDAKGIKERDEFLRRFVEKVNSVEIGIHKRNNQIPVFSKNFHERYAEIRASKQTAQQ